MQYIYLLQTIDMRIVRPNYGFRPRIVLQYPQQIVGHAAVTPVGIFFLAQELMQSIDIL